MNIMTFLVVMELKLSRFLDYFYPRNLGKIYKCNLICLHHFVPDRWEIFPPTSHQLVLDFSQHFEENSDGNMEGGTVMWP